MPLTAARLRELLVYDCDTGQFTWRVRRGNKANAGQAAGVLHRDGYRGIRVDRKRYMAHRLAWLHVTGAWPARQIDHINGDRSDNRFSNLRQATQGENSQNLRSPIGSNNSSRFLGVSWKRRERKWAAQIQIDGVRHYLGLFDDEEEARDAYIAAKRKLHPFQRIAA